MPRRSHRLTVPVLLSVLALAVVSPASAQELPPGFTDGVVVGGDDPAAAAEGPAMAPSVGEASVGAAAEFKRYFGREGYEAVRAAAAAAPRTCTMSVDGLTALVLAPVFKESSAATTAATAPSPMTLSRYDEWSGTFGTGSNSDANYGLYAFRDPFTPYQRAFWHPGIGVWQYDSAGVGAPFTTVESMSVSIMAADVAKGMAGRYCAATGTELARRSAAWQPWGGAACTLCEQYFQELTSTTPRFADLGLVEGISDLGGTVQRTCALAGVSGTLPCWYVEPVVGTIQGATAWATLSPSGGTSPTVAPTPLSYPFYVIDRGTTEERHWLGADTGYGLDIRAIRQIGKNARPRTNQTGTGLAWSSTSGLCDLTASRGSCGSAIPAGVTTRPLSIGGSFRLTTLDANDDGLGDVLFYAPGPAADYLWLGTGPGTFSSTTLAVTHAYDTVLSFDADGDGDDDLLWYDRASGRAALWRFTSDGAFIGTTLAPGANRIPLPLDLNGAPGKEIFWYAPGITADSVWSWNGSGYTSAVRSVKGVYTPITGDFDDNGRDDILWYTPGSGADSVWYHAIAGGFNGQPVTINGTYRTTVGDLDGDGHTDIVFHAPGTAADSVWFGEGVGVFSHQTSNVNRTYTPFTVDILGTGRDAVVWFSPGGDDDALWSWSDTRVMGSQALALKGSQPGVVGGFSAGGADGVLFYGPGSEPDVLWYR